jgi:hypothetical protein
MRLRLDFVGYRRTKSSLDGADIASGVSLPARFFELSGAQA